MICLQTKLCNKKWEKHQRKMNVLTLPVPSLLVPTPYTKGGGGSSRPPSYLKTRCPHEPEILQGIRDTFESLRNVKVVYIVFT